MFRKSKYILPALLNLMLCLVSAGSGFSNEFAFKCTDDTLNSGTGFSQNNPSDCDFFTTKLDSLANSWYVRNHFPGIEGKTGTSEERRLILSDSLIMMRIRNMETVIQFTYNPIVRDFITTFVNLRPAQAEILLGLSARYFPIFEEVFDRFELPGQLKYLAVIGSALNPLAISPSGATGIWQFMYGTAKQLDMEVSTLVDERRDLLRSTEAAARYLKQLYQVYKDWHLVIAAYICGPGNLNKAIDRAGGKTGLLQIYSALPREAREFIPAFIATAYIMTYYTDHQLSPKYPSVNMETDTLMINRFLNLKQISDNLDITIESIRDLNPMYRHDIVPGTPEKGYPVRIPTALIASFIEKSDTIFRQEKESNLMENRIVEPKTLPDGYDIGDIEGKTKIIYTVKSGDNPGYIADWFDISIAELKLWNRISRNLIRTGQKLVVYVPAEKTDYYKKINNLSFQSKQELSGYSVQPNKTATP